MTATITSDEATASNTQTGTHISNPRRLRLLRRAWIVTTLLIIGLFLAALPNEFFFLRDSQRWGLGYQAVLTEMGLSRDFFAAFLVSLEVFLSIYMSGVAVNIFRKRSDDWMALLVSLTLMFSIVSIPLPLTDLNPILGSVFRTLGILMFFVLIVLFPNGRFVPHWTHWLLIAAVPLCLAFIPIQVELFTGSSSVLSGAVVLFTGVILAVMFIGMAAQIYRYRHLSTPIQRQQTKWVILGFATALTATILLLASQIFIPAIRFPLFFPQDITYSRAGLLAMFIIMPLFFIGNIFVPVTIGFSMMRYGLWNVDIVINRSLVYGAVTTLLTLVFGGIILLISLVTQGQGSTVGLIVATAAAGLLFNPVRKQAQRTVDRHIYHLNFDLNQLAAAQKLPDVQHPGALSGRKIGDFNVLDVIGKGGMGEVYKGQHGSQTVALKILPDDLAQQEQFRQRFEREAQTLTALHHPNIVKMVGSGTSDGVAYMAMEFVEGEELGRKIRLNGALSLDDTRDILRGLTSALDYAHEQGFVHRDIKPSNVMLRRGKDGETWEGVLMDFGIAKIREAQTGLTGTGAIGTIDYMAPEQILVASEVDRRADIYALGVMTYEMLTGVCPFKGSAAQVMFAHLQQPAPDPRDMNDDLPSSVAHAVLRALSKKPDDRFATAGDFAAALQ